jgi:hypothetical protein
MKYLTRSQFNTKLSETFLFNQAFLSNKSFSLNLKQAKSFFLYKPSFSL